MFLLTTGVKDLAVPLEKAVGSHALCGIHGEVYPDNKPLGFPLDRRIEDERAVLGMFPNIKKTTVTITHRA